MITGSTIFEEIKGLKEEISELDKSLDALEDSVGSDSLAYKRVKEIYDESKRTLSKVLSARYDAAAPKPKAKSPGQMPDDFVF